MTLSENIMLETLFKSIQGIDEKVFTPELKDRLTEMFDEAVDTKAKLIAEEMVESEKVDLQNQAEQYKQKIGELANEYTEQYKQDLAENVDAFLNSVVERFVDEKESDFNKLLESYKSSSLLQLFEKSNNILGKNLVQVLDPSCNESSNLNQLNNLKQSYNDLSVEKKNLITENNELRKTLMQTICAAVLAEKTHDMTVMQQASVSKLVEMYNKSLNVDNFNAIRYADKIDEICEMIVNKNSTDILDDISHNDLDHGDLKESVINKSGKKHHGIDDSQSWRRFV